MNNICIVYITASGKEEAADISRVLVEKELAACVNIYDNITSIYRWEGEVKDDRETVLFVKTQTSSVPEIKRIVRRMHSYDRPCILAIPIADADKDFADWVISRSGGNKGDQGIKSDNN